MWEHLTRQSDPIPAPPPRRTPALPQPLHAALQLQTAVGNRAAREVLQGTSGGPLAGWLPGASRALSAAAAATPVHPASGVAEAQGAAAVSTGGAIHLARDVAHGEPRARALVLAHEGVHAEQQAAGGTASREALESEATDLAPAVAAGTGTRPSLGAPHGMVLHQHGQPTQQELEELDRVWEATRAPQRRRLAMLRRYRAILVGRQSLARDRAAMERVPGGNATIQYVTGLMAHVRALLPSAPPAVRARAEAALRGDVGSSLQQSFEELLLARINRSAFRVTLLSDTVVGLDLYFQARFEGRTPAQARQLFPELQANLQEGIDAVWSHELARGPFASRELMAFAHVQLVDADAPRDPRYWLITVRPSDDAPLTYQGSLMVPREELPPPGSLPTSVTRTDLDAGVMSIPPRHVGRPNVLGHETLHLFGLIDRYVMQGSQLHSIRATGGRDDPLGAGLGAPILDEDLDFVFANVGAYAAEADRQGRAGGSSSTGVAAPLPTSITEIDEEIARLEAHELPPMAPPRSSTSR